MAFQVPASKASIGQDMFEFEIDGKTYKVKREKFCSVGTLEAIEDTEAVNFFAGSTKQQAAAVRGLDREQFYDLVRAWHEDSEIEPGESAAS